MKGPYERLKYQLCRVWECPACQHHERTGGDVTTMFCRCQRKEPDAPSVCMKLIKDGAQRTQSRDD